MRRKLRVRTSLEAKVRHQLFDSPRLAQAWDWADATHSPQAQLDSLHVLADSRDKLPGAVFFTVPTAGFHLRRNDWKAVLEASVPYCQCPARRVIWPGRGRTRLYPSQRGSHKMESYKHRVAQSYTAQPLVIAPHGGDLGSAFALWTFQGDKFIGMPQPFMREREHERRLLRNSANKGYTEYRPALWEVDVTDLERWVRAYGEVAFQQVVPLHPGYAGDSWLPTCSVTDVSWSPRRRNEPPYPILTFEVDAAVKVLPYDEDVAAHVCNPAIPEP